MGWTVYYQATLRRSSIEAFVKSANATELVLSKNCEPYRWEVAGDGKASGFTKVECSHAPAEDFVAILRELKSLAQKWDDTRILVTDDYYLCEEDIEDVDIDGLIVGDETTAESGQAADFDLDRYLFEYEIKHGIAQKAEDLLPKCADPDRKKKILKAIELCTQLGAKAIYARGSLFEHGLVPIDQEFFFLLIPERAERRQEFFDNVRKLTGVEFDASRFKQLFPLELGLIKGHP